MDNQILINAVGAVKQKEYFLHFCDEDILHVLVPNIRFMCHSQILLVSVKYKVCLLFTIKKHATRYYFFLQSLQHTVLSLVLSFKQSYLPTDLVIADLYYTLTWDVR